MKNTQVAAWLLFSAALIFALAPSVPAQTTNTDSQPAATTEKSPPIPSEARRHFVMGQTMFKDAKSPADFALAADEFLQAARLAPSWPEARYNAAMAHEAAGNFSDAIESLKIYLQFKLPEAEAQAAQDKIWALEAKQKMATTAAAKESEAKAKESSPEAKFEALLEKIDGRRYACPDRFSTSIIDVRGKVLVRGLIDSGRYRELTGEGSRIEIKSRETAVAIHDHGPFTSGYAVSMIYIISEEGDRITVRTRLLEGDVREYVHLWKE